MWFFPFGWRAVTIFDFQAHDVEATPQEKRTAIETYEKPPEILATVVASVIGAEH